MFSIEKAENSEPQNTTLDMKDIADKPVYDGVHDYLQAAAGNNPESKRQPGLYLINEDLQKVKRFCRHVNQLPVNYQQVVSYIGYSEASPEGLGPGGIVTLHRSLQNLAGVWTSVEAHMIKVAAALVAFSGELGSFGSSIIDLIRGMPSYKSYEGRTLDLTSDDLASLPHTPLLDSDLRTLPSLVEVAQELVGIVDRHKQDAQNVTIHIEYFRAGLRTARDDIARKLELAVKYDGSDQITELNEELARHNAQLEELGNTYGTYTNYKWFGAWWGPVGVAITMSIYGPMASQVKTEYEIKIEQKKNLEKEVANISKLMRSLLTLETELQNMQLLTEEALSGSGNMENIWTLIGAYINSSVERIRTTHNATTLFLFETRLSHMLAQWGNVEKEARVLMEVLNQDT
ncbi:alpha-xenorhabdolysin family binary toxin subunit A [Pseudomonas sp. R1-18]|uniref:alpha-xenorhabdolysin family binary toxin subunit A n=1 Tax=Pseudomonas sp. R1-18 TaxID=1632772 RepID=UPI003DA974DD